MEESIVVSEMGEMWSPHTAPARTAEITNASCSKPWSVEKSIVPLRTVKIIGISIPNVPHEVPVANARPTEIRKNIAGRMDMVSTTVFTN